MNAYYLAAHLTISVKRCVPCALRWAEFVRAAREWID